MVSHAGGQRFLLGVVALVHVRAVGLQQRHWQHLLKRPKKRSPSNGPVVVWLGFEGPTSKKNEPR